MPGPASTVPPAVLREALARQFHAGLLMLRRAIEACPETLWADPAPMNPFWRVAYHTLFYTHFYLHPRSEDFRPWARHREHVHFMNAPEAGDPVPGVPAPPRRMAPYSQEELLEYWRICDAFVDPALAALDLASADSGFDWYPIPKIEFVLVDLRHLGHHTGQLCDRVRAATGEGVAWAGSSGRREAT